MHVRGGKYQQWNSWSFLQTDNEDIVIMKMNGMLAEPNKLIDGIKWLLDGMLMT